MIGSTMTMAVLEFIALFAFLMLPKGTCFTFFSKGKKGVLLELCPVSERDPMVRP